MRKAHGQPISRVNCLRLGWQARDMDRLILLPWNKYYFSPYPGRKYHISVLKPGAKVALLSRVWWKLSLRKPHTLSILNYFIYLLIYVKKNCKNLLRNYPFFLNRISIIYFGQVTFHLMTYGIKREKKISKFFMKLLIKWWQCFLVHQFFHL